MVDACKNVRLLSNGLNIHALSYKVSTNNTGIWLSKGEGGKYYLRKDLKSTAK